MVKRQNKNWDQVWISFQTDVSCLIGTNPLRHYLNGWGRHQASTKSKTMSSYDKRSLVRTPYNKLQ